ARPGPAGAAGLLRPRGSRTGAPTGRAAAAPGTTATGTAARATRVWATRATVTTARATGAPVPAGAVLVVTPAGGRRAGAGSGAGTATAATAATAADSPATAGNAAR